RTLFDPAADGLPGRRPLHPGHSVFRKAKLRTVALEQDEDELVVVRRLGWGIRRQLELEPGFLLGGLQEFEEPIRSPDVEVDAVIHLVEELGAKLWLGILVDVDRPIQEERPAVRRGSVAVLVQEMLQLGPLPVAVKGQPRIRQRQVDDAVPPSYPMKSRARRKGISERFQEVAGDAVTDLSIP